MNNLNKTICNIHFLVFNNKANSEKAIFTNIPKKKNTLSWIQALYLKKAIALYGDKLPIIYRNQSYYWSSELTKKTFFKKLPTPKSLIISKKYCNKHMKAYSKVILGLKKNRRLKRIVQHNHFGCTPHDSITWAVSSIGPTTFYPQQNTNTVRKNIFERWNIYFSENTEQSEFLNIDPKFHFSWRNKLIPAHEVIHVVNSMKGSDNHSLSRCEWVASAANLNIYLGYLETKYKKTRSSKNKKIIQLEAIASVLYIIELINSIDRTIKHNYQTDLSIIDEWIVRGVVGDGDYIKGILSAQEPLWRNTYSKHKIALSYCYKFFEDTPSFDFTRACIDDSIWEKTKFEKLTKNKFNMDFWKRASINIDIAKWIKSESKLSKNIYRFIINPITNKRTKTNSPLGRKIINTYYKKI